MVTDVNQTYVVIISQHIQIYQCVVYLKLI